MEHEKQARKQAQNDEKKAAKQVNLPGWLWLSIGIVGFSAAGSVYLIVVGVGLFILSRYLGTSTDPINFIIINLFSALIFAVVTVQAAIYFFQWRAMRDSLDRADKVIEKMQSELDVIERQAEFIAMSESAYLSVGEFEIPPLRDYQLVVNGKLFNRGKTPAFDLERRLQIATGIGTPPVGWGRFDWDATPDHSKVETVLLAANDDINFTTPAVKITDAILSDINEGKQVIVIDGQCRYRDNLGDLLIYEFGLRVELDPRRCHIRYQNHRREKANPEKPN